MNTKRFALSVVAGFVFVFLYESVIHGMLLMDLYTEFAHLWRSEESMTKMVPFMSGMQLLFVLALGWIFTRHYENKGIGEGLRFGAYIGFFVGVTMFSFYAFMPCSMTLAASWFITTFIEVVALGVIFALIYKE